jgi:hypothetical protein
LVHKFHVNLFAFSKVETYKRSMNRHCLPALCFVSCSLLQRTHGRKAEWKKGAVGIAQSVWWPHFWVRNQGIVQLPAGTIYLLSSPKHTCRFWDPWNLEGVFGGLSLRVKWPGMELYFHSTVCLHCVTQGNLSFTFAPK